MISTHALRVEGDERGRAFLGVAQRISTHALRVEGDFDGVCAIVVRLISTHALRVEGDRTMSSLISGIPYFYPRPPRRGRQLVQNGGGET